MRDNDTNPAITWMRRGYSVQLGDTLTAIAAKTLGDAARWHEIFEANRDRIDNPNAISVGMLLRLPGAHAAEAASPAGASDGQGWLWDLAREMGQRHDVDPLLLMAMVQQEPQGHGVGLMQLLPQTARALGVSHPLNPRQSMEGGARYIKWLLGYYNGNLNLALAAYNAGTGAVDRYGCIPPFAETRAFVASVLRAYRASAA